MSNPEFIAQKCDACPNWLAWSNMRSAIVHAPAGPGTGNDIIHFENHSEAHREARTKGWYLAEVDLCPACVEKREVPNE